MNKEEFVKALIAETHRHIKAMEKLQSKDKVYNTKDTSDICKCGKAKKEWELTGNPDVPYCCNDCYKFKPKNHSCSQKSLQDREKNADTHLSKLRADNKDVRFGNIMIDSVCEAFEKDMDDKYNELNCQLNNDETVCFTCELYNEIKKLLGVKK